MGMDDMEIGLIMIPTDPPKDQRRSNRKATAITTKRPAPPPPTQIALPRTGDINGVI